MEKIIINNNNVEEIINIGKSDMMNENANMNSHTPAGQMMKFASLLSKKVGENLISEEYIKAHKKGYIHIHDLDFYPSKTTTCIQYDLDDILKNGFNTKNGSIREPQSISKYASLAAIVFQTNQNEQHGGQAIPAFDFFMAPGVLKSFWKNIERYILDWSDNNKEITEERVDRLKRDIQNNFGSIDVSDEDISNFMNSNEDLEVISESDLSKIIRFSRRDVEQETHQAMEAFIANLNTMHSRGGNQVVFSSINYGTDTSPEGRLVVRKILQATREGLGEGETPIFPIQIFKVKEGINYSEEDVNMASKNWSEAQEGAIKFETPNFDLLVDSCITSSIALFPNFVFLDAPFNKNDLWNINDENRWRYEVATMGCRTRVFENRHGEKSSIGRGNLSFTTINLPRLAIEATIDAKKRGWTKEEMITNFKDAVREQAFLVGEQLNERYEFQKSALAEQFPFMMGNGLWKDSEQLDKTSQVGEVLKHGTLGIGFIGGHNAMVALLGEGHKKGNASFDLLYDTVNVINEVVKELCEKYNLNFSVLATPAEGLSGRFVRMDRDIYGEIEGVTDREYYINSYHVDVKEEISIYNKIKTEAPFHELTKGGHITYVELDGEAKKNSKVILNIVRTMFKEKIGYGSINHPIDFCPVCQFKGIIEKECPQCGSNNIVRHRRITGYLVSGLDTWNSAKKAEERDRVKHK